MISKLLNSSRTVFVIGSKHSCSRAIGLIHISLSGHENTFIPSSITSVVSVILEAIRSIESAWTLGYSVSGDLGRSFGASEAIESSSKSAKLVLRLVSRCSMCAFSVSKGRSSDRKAQLGRRRYTVATCEAISGLADRRKCYLPPPIDINALWNWRMGSRNERNLRHMVPLPVMNHRQVTVRRSAPC